MPAPVEPPSPKFDKDVELVKLQIFSDFYSNFFNSQVALYSGGIFTIFAVVYTLYAAQKIEIISLCISLSIAMLYWVFSVKNVERNYRKNLDYISKLLIRVENGERLPTLSELKDSKPEKFKELNSSEK
jgi:meiotically up-regulated gene 157 (Mug157) protein